MLHLPRRLLALLERVHTARRDERGAILTLVAFSLVGIVGVMGVVVDGSNTFSQRRQMQNAADAASLAGTRALSRLAVGGEAAIWNAVVAQATANGADASTVTCKLATESLVELASCPTMATGTATALKATAAAVRVTVGSTHKTSFMRVLGVNSFKSQASAAAQIQGLRGGTSPFVLCAVGDTDPRAQGDGQSVPILLPDNSINPNALWSRGGPVYELQDPTTTGCGQGNQFKGLANDPNTSFPVPGRWAVKNGDHGINVAKSVVAGNNACRDGFTLNCVVLVPLCHATHPAVQGELYCERFGAFQIVDIQGSSRLSGRLVDGVVAAGGQGGGMPMFGEPHLIKLAE